MLLIQMIAYVCMSIGLSLGFMLAFRLPPDRIRFKSNYRNSFFVCFSVFVALIVMDIITILLHHWQQYIVIIFFLLIKSFLVGFLFISLLYSLFDLKISAISCNEARHNVRLYTLMWTTGIIVSLILNMYYFTELNELSQHYLDTIAFSVLYCRIFISANCAIFLFLVWNAAASIHDMNLIKNIEIRDALSPYYADIRKTPIVTINFVCFACQGESNTNISHRNEDSFSVRTVKEWRKACFTLSGISLFSFTLTAELCQLFLPTLWPRHYYPENLTGLFLSISNLIRTFSITALQMLFAQLTVFAALILARLIMLNQSIRNLFNFQLLKFCPKYVVAYILNIVANLFQVFLMHESYSLILLVSIV